MRDALFIDVRPPLTRDQVTQLQAALPKPPHRPPVVQTRRELAGQKIDVTAIYPCLDGWSVPSDTGHGRYLVVLNDEDRRSGRDEPPWARRPDCTCMDFQTRHVRCKHIVAVFRLLAQYEITMGEATLEYQRVTAAAQEWSP